MQVGGVCVPSWLQVGGSGGHLGSNLEGLGTSWLQDGSLGTILAPSWGSGSHLGSK